jgi:ABC-2 type transport system permease protein
MIVNSSRFYARYVDISFRCQMQYRASFFMRSAGHFLVTGGEFLGFVALFQRFGQIQGWTLPQMGLFYGMISLAFAATEAVMRGFHVFPNLIKSGDFDRFLLRPRSAAFQVLGQDFQLMRAGRFCQALIVLIWSAAQLDVHWTAANVTLLLAGIAGGVCLFSGLVLWQQGRIGISQGTAGAEAPPALLGRYDRQILRNGFRSIFRLLEFTSDMRWLNNL